MKLLGWIKTAVEFVRLPAGPRKAGPQSEAPSEIAGAEIDSHTAPEDPRPDDVRPETRIEVAQENRVTIESEHRAGVESESPIGIESEHRAGVESENPIGIEPDGTPDQQEIDRRRGMVRAFFNDYWSTVDDKPASFAERLDRAEGYINERVAAGGENWRLGAATRKQLGLPPSKKA